MLLAMSLALLARAFSNLDTLRHAGRKDNFCWTSPISAL
jgi:hypothetical protein